MAGQFGATGSSTDVLANDKRKKKVAYDPPSIELSDYSSQTKNNNIESDSTAILEEAAPVSMLILSLSGMSSENTVIAHWTPDRNFPRLRQFHGKVTASISEKRKGRFKVLMTFVFVTMYWSACWDLFGSLPKEQLPADDDNGMY